MLSMNKINSLIFKPEVIYLNSFGLQTISETSLPTDNQ